MPSLTTAHAATQAVAATDLLTGTSIIYGFILWFLMTVPLTLLAQRTQRASSPPLLSGASVAFIVCCFEVVAASGQFWQTGAPHWFIAHAPYFGLALVDGAAVACGVWVANWLYDRHLHRLTQRLSEARDGPAPPAPPAPDGDGGEGGP